MAPHSQPTDAQQPRDGHRLSPTHALAVRRQAWDHLELSFQHERQPDECLLVVVALALIDGCNNRLEWEQFQTRVPGTDLRQFLCDRAPASALTALIENLVNTRANIRRLESLAGGDQKHFFVNCLTPLKDLLRDASHVVWPEGEFDAGLGTRDSYSYAELVYRHRTLPAREPTVSARADVADGGRPPPEPNAELVRMYAINKPTFIKRLAEAERVTIIGITHDNLSREYLPEALKKKREHAKNSRDFWVKMRVVFLAESMLGSVNDEHGKDANAAKNRRDIAADARQRLFQFLTENGASAQCELLEYEWMVPFIGAVLKDSFGQHTVQVATLWPGHSTADLPFIEIHSPHPLADYYEEAFESVIGACNPLDPMALLGVPYLDGGGV